MIIRFFTISMLLISKIYCLCAQQEFFSLVPQTAPTAEVSCTKVSPDGKLLAVGDVSGTVRLYHVQTLMEIKTIVAHAGAVRTIRFSPDLKFLITTGLDNGAHVWETATGKSYTRIFADAYCRDAIFNGNSECMVIADNALINYNIQDKKTRKLVSFSTGQRFKAVISDDLEYIVVTNRYDMNTPKDEQEIVVYQISTGKKIYAYSHKYSSKGYFPEDIQSACLSPDKTHLVVGHNYGIVRIPLSDKKSRFFEVFFNDKAYCQNFQVSFSGYGNHAAVVSFGQMFIYDLTTSTVNRQFPCNDLIDRQYVALNGNATKAIVLNRKYNHVSVFNVETGKMIESKTLKGDKLVFAKYDSKSRTVAIAGFNARKVALWNVDDLRKCAIVDSCAIDIVGHGVISPYKSTMITVANGKEYSYSFLDLKSGQKARKIAYPASRAALNFCFTPDGQQILVGNVLKNIEIIDVKTGSISPTSIAYHSHWAQVFTDGDRVAATEIVKKEIGQTKQLAMWSLKKQLKLFDFDYKSAGAFDNCYQFALSPDESMIAMSYTDKKNEGFYVALFNASNGQYIRKMLNYNYDGSNSVHPGQYSTTYFPVAFSSKSDLVAAGSVDNQIRIFNTKDGTMFKTLQGHSSDITSVMFIENDAFLLSASQDGSARLWNLETGEWTAISSSPDFTKWVVYNSQGYFDASNDGGDLVAMTDGMDCWNIDQFAVWKNRPDLILKGVQSKNTALIGHYSKLYQKRLRKYGLTDVSKSRLMDIPVAEITKQNIQGKTTEVEFTLSDKTGGLLSYNIFVNNVPLFGSKGKSISGNSFSGKELVELTHGRNKIEISCTNADQNESYRAVVYADYIQKATGDLYFLAFGISEYQNPGLNLQFAHKDALDLEKTMKGLKGFNQVHTKVYTNQDVTTENIAKAKEFLANAKVDDTFVLFIAGHGMYDRKGEPEYYYLTYHADTTNLAQTATRFELIEDLLQGIPPRNKLFLMDACESGEIDEEEYKTIAGIENLSLQETSFRGFKSTNTSASLSAQGGSLSGAETNSSETNRTQIYERNRYIFNDLSRRSGAIVFSSSRGSEASQERKDLKQGLFTHFIMKALTTTEADTDKNETVSTDELRNYVSSEVAKASGDLQHPTVDRDNIYQKFGFGVK